MDAEKNAKSEKAKAYVGKLGPDDVERLAVALHKRWVAKGGEKWRPLPAK
jgi:hypothetical protein